MSTRIEFEMWPHGESPQDRSHAATLLKALVLLNPHVRNIYLEVSDYEQPRLTGFYTTGQLRAFAQWLVEMADKQETTEK